MITHVPPAVASWDSTMLALSRVVIVAVVVYALIVLWRVWRDQPADKRQRIIPRPVLVFTIGWLLILGAIVVDLIVQGRPVVSDGWFRTLYAMALIWPIGGLAWIISLGRKVAARVYIRIVDPNTGEMKLVELHDERKHEK